MKHMKRWLGIMMSVMLAVGSLQAPVCAAEAGATAAAAETEEAVESTDESEELSEVEQPEADPAEDQIDDGDSPSFDHKNDQKANDAEEDTATYDAEEDAASDDAEEYIATDDAEEDAAAVSVSNESQNSDAVYLITEGTCGDSVSWGLWALEATDPDTDPDLILTISGTGVIEPDSVDTNWTSYNSVIKKVVIEEGVTGIGEKAFSGFKNLETITIPNTVTNIGANAFQNCVHLKDLTLPTGVKKIENNAFVSCSDLTSMIIPEGVVSIGEWAFSHCTNLESIVLPESLLSIEQWAFQNCISLSGVILPSGLRSIGEGAFWGCYELPGITIPGSLTDLGLNAFYDCKSLVSVTLEDGIETIGERAFVDCFSLMQVSIPSSVTSIEDHAFDCCYGLRTIEVPEGVTRIGKGAFANCTNLAEVQIPESVTCIDEYAFRGCSSLESIVLPVNITTIETGTFYDCAGLKNVSIPDSVVMIKSQAFWGCKSLPDVGIPENVTEISREAFCNCESLTKILIPEKITVIYEETFRNCNSLTAITIPESVTSVRMRAFNSCDHLEKAVIPASVTEIQYGAFLDENGYPLPELVIYGYSGSCAEQYANENEIPFVEYSGGGFNETVSGVLREGDGWKILWKCDYIESISGEKSDARLKIYIEGSNEDDGTLFLFREGSNPEYSGPWISETGLRKEDFLLISIEGSSVNPLCTISEQFKDYSLLREVRLAYVEEIESKTFENCTNLTRITGFDKGLSIIANEAFKNTGLTVVELPSSIAYIGDHAFQSCKSLTEADVPGNALTFLGEGVFQDCTKLQIANVDGQAKKITDGMFKGCENLKTFVFYDDIKEIGEAAFSGCKKLNEPKISVTVEHIGENAFSGCDSLREVIYTGTKHQWDKIRIEAGNECLTDAYIYFNTLFDLKALSYSFVNRGSSFGYPTPYKIPEERYKVIFGDAVAELLYNKAKDWGGNCYGMIVSSAMFNTYGSGIVLSDFGGRSTVGELSTNEKSETLNITVRDLIEIMQISVYRGIIQDEFNRNTNYGDLHGFFTRLKKEIDERRLVIIDMKGTVYDSDLNHVEAEHAVLAYEYKMINNNEERIYVYDPNRPYEEEYIKIDLNDKGLATSWAFNFGFLEDWGTGHPEEAIKYLPLDKALDVWKSREKNKENADNRLVSVNADSFDIINASNEVIGRVRNGIMEYAEDELSLLDPIDMEFKSNLFYYPGGEFSIVNMDSQTETLEVSLAGDTKLASINTSGSQVYFDMDEAKDTCVLSAAGDSTETFNVSIKSFEDQTESSTEFSGQLSGGEITVGIENGEIVGGDIEGITITKDGEEINDGPVPVSISECSIEKIGSKTYTGKEITPELSVTLGSSVLVADTDYTVSYENNIEPGTATVTITGIGKYTGTATGTFTILPGKTTRGDMFNLAGNVKVTWKEVPGAKYYKVYREGITDSSESLDEPVIVTERLIGWDKEPGLTNGHAYRYKIVASLTGKGDPSGDSSLSYSKLMYRLKTVVIRSVKNTEPGKVTVKYDKTTSGDSYVLQYCEREDMVGAKTKVVLGANNTSYTIGGLKKGKTYYISIRVRKKVDGIDYYTTFGVAKKITLTK